MVCKERGSWCAYWIGEKCVADDMHSAYKCIFGPTPVPLWSDTWKVIGLVDMTELRAQADVADMIIRKAQPNDPSNPIDVAECEQVREDCQEFLDILSRFNRGVFKKGEDIFEGGDRLESSDADTLTESQIEPAPLPVEEGEWV